MTLFSIGRGAKPLTLLLCAWVLWQKDVQVPGFSDGDLYRWWLIEATETKAACDVLAAVALREAKTADMSRIGHIRIPGKDDVSYTDAARSFIKTTKYLCLPAATDPRPRTPPK